MNRAHHPNQEPLIPLADRTGQMVVPDFTADVPDHVLTDITTSIHYINALNGISEVNSHLGFVAASNMSTHRPRLEEEYGNALDGMTVGARAKIKHLGNTVKWEFARAIDMFSNPNREEAKQQAKKRFDEFRTEYDGTGNAVKRSKHIDFLRKNVDALVAQYSENRRAGTIAVPVVESLVIVAEVDDDIDDMQLNTPGRMQAISLDPRAGFLPATNEEKNTVLAFLDYMDNPRYPIGIRNQFNEIFNHSERVYKVANGKSAKGQAGLDAVVSITHEIADFYANAQAQLAHLQDLQIALAEPYGPNVTLLELAYDLQIEFPHPSHRALVRYMDLSEVTQSTNARAEGLKYSPLATVRNENNVGVEGKNKVIEDRYTGVPHHGKKFANINEAFNKRINKKVMSLTAREARELTNRAIINEEKRLYFMWSQLDALTTCDIKAVKKIARSVLAPEPKTA